MMAAFIAFAFALPFFFVIADHMFRQKLVQFRSIFLFSLKLNGLISFGLIDGLIE